MVDAALATTNIQIPSLEGLSPKIQKLLIKTYTKQQDKQMIADALTATGREGSAIVQKVFDVVKDQKVALYVLMIILVQQMINMKLLNNTVGSTMMATLSAAIVTSSILPWE